MTIVLTIGITLLATGAFDIICAYPDGKVEPGGLMIIGGIIFLAIAFGMYIS